MSIIHGRSEYVICEAIKSHLRIKHEIEGKNGGKRSIQVTSILAYLSNDKFKSLSSFKRHFPDVKIYKKTLCDFKLFVIMDVDDCSTIEKEMFICGEMLKGHWMYEYIVPIYNEPNLEVTMRKASIQIDSKKDYIKVFPTNHSGTNIEMVEDFADSLRGCTSTNMEEYVDYCVMIAKDDLI